MYVPLCWQRYDLDPGGFKKLMWYGILKEFNCNATSAWSKCGTLENSGEQKPTNFPKMIQHPGGCSGSLQSHDRRASPEILNNITRFQHVGFSWNNLTYLGFVWKMCVNVTKHVRYHWTFVQEIKQVSISNWKVCEHGKTKCHSVDWCSIGMLLGGLHLSFVSDCAATSAGCTQGGDCARSDHLSSVVGAPRHRRLLWKMQSRHRRKSPIPTGRRGSWVWCDLVLRCCAVRELGDVALETCAGPTSVLKSTAIASIAAASVP